MAGKHCLIIGSEAASAVASLKIKLERAAAQAERGEFVTPGQVLRKIDRLKKQKTSMQR